MCGRITTNVPRHELDRTFTHLRIAPNLAELLAVPRYNVAPTQPAPIVLSDADAGLCAEAARWQLKTGWDLENQNAKAEKFTTAYRPFNQQRCLIVAGGYYEWAKPPGFTKGDPSPPHYITRADDAPMLLAGLYTFLDPDDRKPTEPPGLAYTCANITVAPDESGPLRRLHHRAVAIIEPEHVKTWLSRTTPITQAAALLKEPPAGLLKWHRVAPLKGDSAELIKPV